MYKYKKTVGITKNRQQEPVETLINKNSSVNSWMNTNKRMELITFHYIQFYYGNWIEKNEQKTKHKMEWTKKKLINYLWHKHFDSIIILNHKYV